MSSDMRVSAGLMPSMFDRLTDPDSGGTSAMPGYTLKQMMDVVRRDLEKLLNTRQCFRDLKDDYPELHNTLLTFGLPDFGSISASTLKEQRDLGQLIADQVMKFEPRLRKVRAIPELDHELSKLLRVRYHIEATLAVDPAPEVAFETVLELTTGHTSVKGIK
ncbi:Type VI secretion system baseplate subunit TssE [Planctomycetales bacterium 10988]|nr:Type VI secretion system baseplate subunit TssE [Planctomycetales bacterium 10988]